MNTVLILADAADRGAGEVARRVAGTLGPDAVRLVTTAQLERATWTHRVANGVATTRLTPPGHAPLDCTDAGVVLNRVVALENRRFARASERDAAYAHVEMQALFASWLASFECAVINPVDGHGSMVSWLPTAWARAAHRAGLATTAAVRTTSARLAAVGADHSVVRADHTDDETTTRGTVIGRRFVAPGDLLELLGDDGVNGCVELASALHCPLLGLAFVLDSGNAEATVQLQSVDAFPALHDIAAPVADYLITCVTAYARRIAS